MDVNDKYPFGRAAYSRDGLQRSLVAPLDPYPAVSSGPPKRFGPQAKARNPRGGRPMVETVNNFSNNGLGPNSRGATNPNSTVDLGTVKNDYAQGGDGTVARAPGPDRYNTNIAGGLSRDELIRRMEMASTTMRGSPSARAAVLGVYADQVKALDQGELEKNKGNIDASQLQYKGETDANMQEARGRQDFGNNMGILNRKAELDAAAAAAAANDPYRKAQLENLTSQTELNRAKALNEAASRTISDTAADQRTYLDMEKSVREKLGANATPEQIAAETTRQTQNAGMYNTNTQAGNIARAEDAQALSGAIGKGDSWLTRMFASGEQPKYVLGGQPKIDVTDTANLEYYDASNETLGGKWRSMLNLPTYKVFDKTQGDPRENLNAPSRVLAPAFFGVNEDEQLIERLKRVKKAGERTDALKPSQSISGY